MEGHEQKLPGSCFYPSVSVLPVQCDTGLLFLFHSVSVLSRQEEGGDDQRCVIVDTVREECLDSFPPLL